MRFSTWTLLPILTLVTNTFCKALHSLDTNSVPLVAPPINTPEYTDDPLEELKDRIRSRASSHRTLYNSLPQLNKTIEEKRLLLRQYREKLREMNELDESMDNQQTIHKRDLHSYKSTEDGKRVGYYSFALNIPPPTDHRKESKVQSAVLKLYRKTILLHKRDKDLKKVSSKRNIGHNTVLLVYQTLPGNMRRLVTSKVISLARSDWIKIDVTEIAQSWVDERGMNHGLEVECTNHNISHILEQTSDLQVPTLDIITYEKAINVRRRRREVTTTQQPCTPGRCCRQAVNILYSDVGLHIDGYHEDDESLTAYVCNGRCSHNPKLHNYWSRMKHILKKKYPHSKYKNRCSPIAYEDFDYLHLDDNGAWDLKLYDDIIVKECACL